MNNNVNGPPGGPPPLPNQVSEKPPRPPRFEVGDVIGGRFEIEAFLGMGGMGEVYRALDRALGDRVALKALAANVVSDSFFADRLSREIQNAIKVTHANVCRVRDYIGDGCFTMELIEGQSLLDLIKARRPPWPTEDVLATLKGIAAGLDAIHAAGVVHRDLKPANVMITHDGDVKIMDFGLARSFVRDDQLTNAGFVPGPGTPQFMAPEQVAGDEPRPETDVWAFGVIAYILVTGVPPFWRKSELDIYHAIGQPVREPRSHNPQLSSAWNTAVLRCLTQEPDRRFKKASHFISAVVSALIPSHAGNSLVAIALPDIWTPALSEQAFLAAYHGVLGPARSANLWAIAEEGVRAVERGDFGQQVALGRAVELAFEDVPLIAASGTYFLAEGLRLSASLERDAARRSQMLDEAADAYSTAVSRLPLDARPLRGLGRVLELQGNLGDAERVLARAKALAVAHSVPLDPVLIGSAHEQLRATRHYIHCVLDIRNDSPASAWNSERKDIQLQGYIVECADLHYQIMPHYAARREWSRIEWFMAFVFLGKAWAAVGDVGEATFALLHALRSRVELIPDEGALSDVEQSNIAWWVSVANSLKNPGDVIIRRAADKIAQKAALGQRRDVKAAAAAILYPFLPPDLPLYSAPDGDAADAETRVERS